MHNLFLFGSNDEEGYWNRMHDWFKYDERDGWVICKRCGTLGGSLGNKLSCEEVVKANKSHEWKLKENNLKIDYYECIRCKMEGFRWDFGTVEFPEAEPKVSGFNPIFCSEIIMRKVLE